MGMAEIIYYARFEEDFEAFPSENYVDYMTNVMPVPERHFFYIPWRDVAIACEVRRDVEGKRIFEWSLNKYDAFPENKWEIQIDRVQVEDAISFLTNFDSPHLCDVCDKILGSLLRFY